MKKVICSLLFFCLALLLSMEPANASLLSPKSYSLNYYYTTDVTAGFQAIASTPVDDLGAGDPNTAINKTIWLEFSQDGGFIETGALKGANLIDIGTWIGFYHANRICSPTSCTFHLYTVGSYNPSGISSIRYEFVKDTDHWKILHNGSVIAVTDYVPANNAYRAEAGIENSGSLNTFTTGTNFTDIKGNNGSGWNLLTNIWFEYNTGSYPPGLDATFIYPFNTTSNYQANNHS